MRARGLLHRLRAGLHPRAWSRWVAVVLAFNVALGMGVSVVLLRHGADARRDVELALAQLDAETTIQQAALWQAVASGGLEADSEGELDAAAAAVAAARTRLDTAAEPVQGQAALLDRVGRHEADTERARSLLVVGDAAGARALLVGRIDPGADALHAAIGAAVVEHQAGSRRTGRVADGETLFMMVFAAAVAGLLFRRFEAARSAGELRAAAERERAEARFRSLVDHSSDLISITDPHLVLRWQTPSVARLLGHAPEALVGTPLTDLVHPEDRLRLLAVQDDVVTGVRDDATSSVRLRHRDGTWRHVETVHTNLLGDPAVGGVVLTTRDVTDQRALQEQLAHNAFHDALTGLANRALFADRLAHALAGAERGGEPLAVLFVGLDDFKAVNDELGHAAGDALLVAAAERLRGCVRGSDTVARLGGDEFAVLLEDASGGRAEEVAGRVLERLRDPFAVAGTEVGVAASVGIALSAADEHDAEEVLRNADVAMCAAKAAGKDRSAAFDPAMDEGVLGRLRLKAELQHALEAGQFTLHYQPIVDLGTGVLDGVEALVRWQHPVRGAVPPAEFIPVAEQTGLIVPLGRWVLREACRQAAAWHAATPDQRPLHVSVNVSARELAEPGLVEQVRLALADTGLAPGCLTLEVTETMLMADLPVAAAKLAQLRQLGIQLAIDDFGTGYSSLNYLEQLPVHTLKIDKSFVDRLARDSEDGGPVMVQAISQLGHALELRIVAEGIETPEQVAQLRAFDCQLGQGYWFARPLPAEELEVLLRRRDAVLPLAAAAPETAALAP